MICCLCTVQNSFFINLLWTPIGLSSVEGLWFLNNVDLRFKSYHFVPCCQSCHIDAIYLLWIFFGGMGVTFNKAEFRIYILARLFVIAVCWCYYRQSFFIWCRWYYWIFKEVETIFSSILTRVNANLLYKWKQGVEIIADFGIFFRMPCNWWDLL